MHMVPVMFGEISSGGFCMSAKPASTKLHGAHGVGEYSSEMMISPPVGDRPPEVRRPWSCWGVDEISQRSRHGAGDVEFN